MIVPTMPCRALFRCGFAATEWFYGWVMIVNDWPEHLGRDTLVVAADRAAGVHRALHADRRLPNASTSMIAARLGNIGR